MSSIVGVNATLQTLRKAQRALSQERVSNACFDVAQEAADLAQTVYNMADYDGDRNVTVEAKKHQTGATITASGQAVLFMEFGAGITHASEQHPFNSEFGFGPGTYNPDSPNWSNPNGWYFTDPITGQTVRTKGNPPALAMYEAGKTVKERIEGRIRREVFGND